MRLPRPAFPPVQHDEMVTSEPESRSVDRLRLTDFRSYAAVDIAPGPGLVAISGPNGAGKTNLLEAISLLAPGRGLRRASLDEMAHEAGAGGFAVAARIGCGDDTSIHIGTGIEPARPARRHVRVNGAAQPANALSEWLSVLWLTPAMDRLFLEGAGGRRRFLDRMTLALYPGHADAAARYEAAMRERNRLLGEGRGGKEWLHAVETEMAAHGTLVAEARGAAVKSLSAALAAQSDGPFPCASVALDGTIWSSKADLADALAASRLQDLRAGRTLVGPHRADLLVRHAEKDQPAARASTGEQKALLLGLVTAHAALVASETGRRPVLLLDEALAHLDEGRRRGLFDLLADQGGQVWMTGTDSALFRAISGPATYIEMEGGVPVLRRS